jgi:hypothetical protein
MDRSGQLCRDRTAGSIFAVKKNSLLR